MNNVDDEKARRLHLRTTPFFKEMGEHSLTIAIAYTYLAMVSVTALMWPLQLEIVIIVCSLALTARLLMIAKRHNEYMRGR